MRIGLAAVLLALSIVTAAAQEPKPFDPKAYPPDVQAAVRYGNEECASHDGGKATLAANTVRSLDLTGDGRADYIVDFRDAECDTYVVAYCGTGGCDFNILVALPSGRYRSVFSDRVLGYEVLPGRGARTIRFQLHGSYCGRGGGTLCYKTRRITAKPFAFKQR